MNALSKRNLFLVIVFLLVALLLKEASAYPSGKVYPPTFTKGVDGDWYDSWGFDRNRYYGNDGYMPNIAYETLGTYKELAYSIGEQFKASYTSKVQRAEAVLKYVQRWTDYGYDVDNVRAPDGTAQAEWAWNADEMAHMFNTVTNTVAIGDCEDMAFLCATIYIGAGFDAAMVIAPSHAALLIWLPEYPNANYYWDIHDGRGKGWIWVEATGERNPLGWTPPDFNDGKWTAYPLEFGLIIFNVSYIPQNPQAENDVTVTASIVSPKANVSQVSLDYSIQGVHTTLTMALNASVYAAVIPKQPKGTTVEFHISATDSEGNTKETGNFSYTVGKGFEIPGFPWESIVIGLVVGIALLAFFMRMKSTQPKPIVPTLPSV
jgi:hypothetical protein